MTLFTQNYSLTKSVPHENYGNSVAFSSDQTTLAIGAPGSFFFNVGATYIYTTTDNWETSLFLTKLVGGSQIGNSLQGFSVAISSNGNVVVIGGPGDNGGVGAAWVFTTSNNWITNNELRIVPDNINGLANFGLSVSIGTDVIEGDILASSGRFDSQGTVHNGATWMISTNNNWTSAIFKQKLQGGVPIFNKRQGNTISLNKNGKVLAVGTPEFGTYIFTSTDNWTTFSQPFTTSTDQGRYVGISPNGNVLAASNPSFNGGIGKVYVYATTDNWISTSQTSIEITDNIGASWFGSSMSFSGTGNVLAIGGSDDDGNFPANIGATWIFETNNNWTTAIQTQKVIGTSPYGTQGWSVSLSSDSGILAVGGPLDKNYDQSPGATLIFSRVLPTPPTPPTLAPPFQAPQIMGLVFANCLLQNYVNRNNAWF